MNNDADISALVLWAEMVADDVRPSIASGVISQLVRKIAAYRRVMDSLRRHLPFVYDPELRAAMADAIKEGC